MPRSWSILAALTALVVVALGCARSPNVVGAPYALSSWVDWSPLEVVAATSVSGEAVDAVVPPAGAVLRLTGGPRVRWGERTAGGLEIWREAPTEDGVFLLRTGFDTAAVLVPSGRGDEVRLGRAGDPGYAWFHHEAAVLAWAEAGREVAFPEIGPSTRFDLGALRRVDEVIAHDAARAPDAAVAARRVIGLRMVRAARPPGSFPYFADADVDVPSERTALLDDEKFHAVAAGASPSITVTGPGLLVVSLRGERGKDDAYARVTVREGATERAVGGGAILHARPKVEGAPAPIVAPSTSSTLPADVVVLHRATAHVPPGAHTYSLEVAGAAVLARARLLKPFVHLEDALSGRKSEARQLERARTACDVDGAPGLCLVALALAGEEASTAAARARASAGEAAVKAAAIVSAGGPRDPTADMELAGSRGDVDAVALLASAHRVDVDDAVRGSWEVAAARGTVFEPIDAGTPLWDVVQADPDELAACPGAAPVAKSQTISREVSSVPSVLWQGVRAVALLAEVSCEGGEPVVLEVDGEKIAAQPSGATTLWHVAVKGEKANVRRLDAGAGKVTVSREGACAAQASRVRSPLDASKPVDVSFGEARAVGLEVWVEESAKRGELTVAGTGGQSLQVRAPKAPGLVVVDARGRRHTRVGRVLLPEWAGRGVRVVGETGTSVRPIGRVGRGPTKEAAAEATAPPEGDLIGLSRRILATTAPRERASLLLERATLLARSGAERAARDDALAAQGLGIADAEERVRAALRPAPKPADTVAAYGLEPDFDPGAKRCGGGEGPRRRLLAFEEQLRARVSRVYDFDLAVRGVELARESARDPRAERDALRAMWGSRWRVIRDAAGAPRVPEPDDRTKQGPIDGEGELRPRVLSGEPFGKSDFVSIAKDRPAKAMLSMTGFAHARVEAVCAARRPDQATGACPFEVVLGGGAPKRVTFAAGGRADVDLGRVGRGPLELRLADAPGRWVVVARVVFDKAIAGTKPAGADTWVLEAPHVQYRYSVRPGQPLSVRGKGPAIYRVDVKGAPETDPGAVISVDGREDAIAAGETKMVSSKSGDITVSAPRGAASVNVAERAPEEAPPEGFSPPDPSIPSGTTLATALDPQPGPWRDVAKQSPRPLSPFEDALGTFVAQMAGAYGTDREGSAKSTAPDGFVQTRFGYRRRVESIHLWTAADGILRARDGDPTYGGSLTLYEDASSIHLRLTGTGLLVSQNIGAQRVVTFRPRAFAEYSWRVFGELFILPRLGFDGYYTNAGSVAGDPRQLDDEVYNSFRLHRNTAFYFQTLFWWVPNFNDIFILRPRLTFDATNAEINHVAVRGQTLLVFGSVDVAPNVEVTNYFKTATQSSALRASAGGTIDYQGWVAPGSVGVRPFVTGVVRFDGGGYQVFGGVELLASFRRGVRDYSSLELAFPEPVAGGIAWRGDGR